jgi:hypothetical protein
MTLPSSGPISMNNVNVELGYSGTALISLNDTAVRTLFGVASGQISLSDGYGKSNTTYFIMAYQAIASPCAFTSYRNIGFNGALVNGSSYYFYGSLNTGVTYGGIANTGIGYLIVKTSNAGAYSASKWYGLSGTGCCCRPYTSANSSIYKMLVNPADGYLYGYSQYYGYNTNYWCGAPDQGFYYNAIRRFDASTLALVSSTWAREFDTYARGYSVSIMDNVYLDASNNTYFAGYYTFNVINYCISCCPIAGTGELLLKTNSSGSSLTYAQAGTRASFDYQIRSIGNTSSAQYSSTQILTSRAAYGYRTQTANYYIDFKLYTMSTGALTSWYRGTGLNGFSSYAETVRAVDSSSNIYNQLTINAVGVLKTGMAKYNSSMVQQWNISLWHSGSNDYGTSAAIDSSGNSYLCGYTYSLIDNTDPCNPKYGYMGTLFKFNSSGVLQWRRYFYTANGAADTKFSQVQVTSSGALLLVGTFNTSATTWYGLGVQLNSNGSGTGTYTIDGIALTYAATPPYPATTVFNSASIAAYTYTYQATQPTGYAIINVPTTSPTNFNWNLTTAQGQSVTNRQIDTSANLNQTLNYNFKAL